MKRVTKIDYASNETTTRPKIGVVGVGHYTYWGQFPGLLDEMYNKLDLFVGKLPEYVDVLDFGMIDDAEKAYKAVDVMTKSNLDLLFCDMVTYATSGTFAIIMRNLNIPIVLVAL